MNFIWKRIIFATNLNIENMNESIKKLFIGIMMLCVTSVSYMSNYAYRQRIEISHVTEDPLEHDGKTYRVSQIIKQCPLDINLDIVMLSLNLEKHQIDHS